MNVTVTKELWTIYVRDRKGSLRTPTFIVGKGCKKAHYASFICASSQDAKRLAEKYGDPEKEYVVAPYWCTT